MTYVRHRDRMVQESVQEDLANTLIACRWLAGETTRPVVSPYDQAAGFQIVTTQDEQVLKVTKGSPVVAVDYFPESTTDEAGLVDQPDSGHTAPNTLAMDDGESGEPVLLELGSNLMEVQHRFTFAFSASSVGVAQALLNDLRDRYLGNLVNGDAITLYDYNTDPDVPVVRMEVDSFVYRRAGEDEVAPFQATLYYAQLTITDIVDDTDLVPVQTPVQNLDTLEGDLVLATPAEQDSMTQRLTIQVAPDSSPVLSLDNPNGPIALSNDVFTCTRDGLYSVAVFYDIQGMLESQYFSEIGVQAYSPDSLMLFNYRDKINARAAVDGTPEYLQLQNGLYGPKSAPLVSATTLALHEGDQIAVISAQLPTAGGTYNGQTTVTAQFIPQLLKPV